MIVIIVGGVCVEFIWKAGVLEMVVIAFVLTNSKTNGRKSHC